MSEPTEADFLEAKEGSQWHHEHVTKREYTTTTDEVRDAFIEAGPWTMNDDAAVKAFEHWLAAHDAEVWDEGYGDVNDVVTPRMNPYREVQR